MGGVPKPTESKRSDTPVFPTNVIEVFQSKFFDPNGTLAVLLLMMSKRPVLNVSFSRV